MARYSPSGSSVIVAARRTGQKSVQITVIDQGKGVPEEWADKIFEKFIQIESDGNAAVVGSGHGLAFARQTVEAQGGRIWVETKRKHGTAVSFTLPAPLRSGRKPHTSNQASS